MYGSVWVSYEKYGAIVKAYGTYSRTSSTRWHCAVTVLAKWRLTLALRLLMMPCGGSHWLNNGKRYLMMTNIGLCRLSAIMRPALFSITLDPMIWVAYLYFTNCLYVTRRQLLFIVVRRNTTEATTRKRKTLSHRHYSRRWLAKQKKNVPGSFVTNIPGKGGRESANEFFNEGIREDTPVLRSFHNVEIAK